MSLFSRVKTLIMKRVKGCVICKKGWGELFVLSFRARHCGESLTIYPCDRHLRELRAYWDSLSDVLQEAVKGACGEEEAYESGDFSEWDPFDDSGDYSD